MINYESENVNMALEIVERGKNFVLYSDNTIKLLRARLSFCHLAEKWAHKPTDIPKYATAVLLPKDTHDEAYQVLKRLCTDMPAEKKVKVAKKDWFLRDGDDSKYENEFGHWTFNASETRKPPVYYKDGSLIPDNDIEEEVPSGIIADIIIQPWVQNNDHGTKVNASLRSVRVREDDGTRYGAAPIDVSEAWDDEDDFADDDL